MVGGDVGGGDEVEVGRGVKAGRWESQEEARGEAGGGRAVGRRWG